MWYTVHVPAHRTITKTCPICDGRVRTNASKYCGKTCYLIGVKNQREAVIEAWNAGDTSVVTQPDGDLTTTARKYLRNEAGNKCTQCGWNEKNPVDGIVPLQVDHIDGDSTNHLRENLVVLCPNCHSLTPTYGMKNRGNGRKSRRTGD